MSRAGRPSNTVPTVEVLLRMRADLAAQVDLLITDPVRNKPRYGVRSRLGERLFADWIERAKKAIAEGRDPLQA